MIEAVPSAIPESTSVGSVPGDAVVYVDHLNHFFGDGPTRKQALFDCCLKVGPGELVIMTGPSGSGKTTLLTLIGALRSTQEGVNRVLGQELRGLDAAELVNIRRNIGFIFQMHNLFDSLSSLENVRMSMELRKYSSSDMLRLATEMLTKLGLGHRVHYKPRQMSGGQRQRVAIARALVNRPKLVLADEPTAALDKKSSRDVVEMLQALTREEQATILMVTHDSRILDVADRIVNFVDGRIESDVIVNDTIKICEILKKSDVFQHLSPTELLNIAQKMKREQFGKGEAVFKQGDEGDKFYLISEGEVDVLIQKPNEDPKVINHLSSGAFFGEKALLSGDPRSASIVATVQTTLYALGKQDFQSALAASGSFNEQLRKVAFQR
ncbi:MAG: ATP-binding cassette domain-containing protein [Planctomycetaceae bacterium]